MTHYTGKAIIRIDGEELVTEDGATLNPGGQNRKAAKGGGKVHGYQEEDVEPSLKCVVKHKKGTSLRYYSDITDATVMYETDSGMEFVLRGAFTSKPATLSSKEGNVDLEMSSLACDEI